MISIYHLATKSNTSEYKRKIEFLKEEYQKIYDDKLTPWCENDGCHNCGPCTPEQKKVKKNNKKILSRLIKW